MDLDRQKLHQGASDYLNSISIDRKQQYEIEQMVHQHINSEKGFTALVQVYNTLIFNDQIDTSDFLNNLHWAEKTGRLRGKVKT